MPTYPRYILQYLTTITISQTSHLNLTPQHIIHKLLTSPNNTIHPTIQKTMANTSTSPLSKLKSLLPTASSNSKTGYISLNNSSSSKPRTVSPATSSRSVSPLSKTSDSDECSTSLLEPSDDEFEDDCVDVEDEDEGEWTDAALMDYARPGRRAGAKAEVGKK
jgi:hypothetical protein